MLLSKFWFFFTLLHVYFIRIEMNHKTNNVGLTSQKDNTLCKSWRQVCGEINGYVSYCNGSSIQLKHQEAALPWLSGIPAPVGSQEFTRHTHRWTIVDWWHLCHASVTLFLRYLKKPIYRWIWYINLLICHPYPWESLNNCINSCDPMGAGLLW